VAPAPPSPPEPDPPDWLPMIGRVISVGSRPAAARAVKAAVGHGEAGGENLAASLFHVRGEAGGENLAASLFHVRGEAGGENLAASLFHVPSLFHVRRRRSADSRNRRRIEGGTDRIGSPNG
jgi:hypothetical protein